MRVQKVGKAQKTKMQNESTKKKRRRTGKRKKRNEKQVATHFLFFLSRSNCSEDQRNLSMFMYMPRSKMKWQFAFFFDIPDIQFKWSLYSRGDFT